MPRRNDSLLKALIQSPHALPPPHPQALTVAPQQVLPPRIGFGPASPPALGRSGYSGAVTSSPLNVVHPQPQAEFQAPAYAPLQPIRAGAPSLPITGSTLPQDVTVPAAGPGPLPVPVPPGSTAPGPGPTPPPVIPGGAPPRPGPVAPSPVPGRSLPVGSGYLPKTGLIGALLANPAIGKRGVYRV
jgi:hypothetical protein